jgi:hypothetical protein
MNFLFFEIGMSRADLSHYQQHMPPRKVNVFAGGRDIMQNVLTDAGITDATTSPVVVYIDKNGKIIEVTSGSRTDIQIMNYLSRSLGIPSLYEAGSADEMVTRIENEYGLVLNFEDGFSDEDKVGYMNALLESIAMIPSEFHKAISEYARDKRYGIHSPRNGLRFDIRPSSSYHMSYIMHSYGEATLRLIPSSDTNFRSYRMPSEFFGFYGQAVYEALRMEVYAEFVEIGIDLNDPKYTIQYERYRNEWDKYLAEWESLNRGDDADYVPGTWLAMGETPYRTTDTDILSTFMYFTQNNKYVRDNSEAFQKRVTWNKAMLLESWAKAVFDIERIFFPLMPQTPSEWAVESVTSAIAKGFVPADIQYDYHNPITRADFCRLSVNWLEYKTGKSVDAILAEKGLTCRQDAFSDTNDPAILAAYALGITSGTTEPTADKSGVFSTNGQFSREQAATMIRNVCRVAEMGVSDTADAGFADIDAASSWAVDSINFAYNAGLMGGTSTTELVFNPKGVYTRQESIVVFDRII